MPVRLIFPVCFWVLCLNFSFAQQPSPKLMLPIGSKLEVLSAQFSPDGKRIVTASADKTALVWDAVSGNLLLILDDHKDIVSYAEFSPDGKKIVTSSYDNMVRVWDAETGERLYTLKGHKDSVLSARFSPDSRKIVSASADATAKLWDVDTRRLIADLSGHDARVNSAEFSPDGTMIVSASTNGTTALWNVKTGMGKYLGAKAEDQHRASVTSASFSKDNKFIVTGSEDRTIKIWDVSSGKLLKTLQKHTDKINSAQFSPDGTKVVTSSRDKTARIWNVADGTVLFTLEGHTNSLKSAQFTRDGKKIITTSFDTTARIWDVATGHADTVLKGHRRTVWAAAISKDNTKFVTASYDGTAKVWDLATGSMITDLKGHTNWVYSAQFSPDGKKIVTATDDSTIKIWDAITGTLLTSLTGHRDWVYSALFSPDGKKIVSTSRDKTTKVWDIGTGGQDFNFRVKDNAYQIIFTDYSPDGSKIAFVTSEDSVKIIDAVTWNEIPCSIGHPQMVTAKFSPDGQKIITSSGDSTAKIWDLASGKLLQTLSGHNDGVLFAAYSPDNSKILTTSLDRTAMIWNSSGLAIDTLIGHTEKIIYAAFSPDSKKVITASEDKTTKVWEVKSGKLLFTLKGHTDWVNTAQFDPTGKKIITASGDNTVKVWNADNGKLLYTFFAVDSTDYLVVDPYNHFDGTENARNLLYFTCGSEKITLDQVKGDLWEPGLVERINNGEPIKAKTLDQLDVCGLIPEVEATGNSTKEFQFKVTPRKGGLGETVLFVNGIEARRFKTEELIRNNYEVNIKKDSLKNYFLANEENWISLKAYTGDNYISSQEAKISIDKDADETYIKPNLYAVMVGTSQYKEAPKKSESIFDTNINLSYPAIDARAISQTVERAAKKMYGNDHVFMFNLTTDSADAVKPNKQNIKKALELIGKKATANDILLIFLSGHGVMTEENDTKQFYYLTADATNLLDERSFPRVGISTEELTDWISPKNIRAQKRILILDACHSGQAINSLLENAQQTRSVPVARTDDRSQMIKEIDKLNERSGLFILSASASNKLAFESDKYSHGYLTYSLLKTIKQQPDILEDGKNLNISRWFNAAGRSVSDIAKEENNDQKTQIFSVVDFNIGEVDSAVISNIRLQGEKPLFTASSFQNADTAAYGDDLGLTRSVNETLREISTKGKESKIVFAMSYPGSDAYSMEGSYKLKDDELNIKIRIKRGKEEICKFEEKGMADKEKMKELADRIIKRAVDCVEAKK
ncbi:MAG TPA: caspase family protein [Chitinophagaceae bacterium]|nr:caspase family protein [Chitinophagaceae bacterium]